MTEYSTLKNQLLNEINNDKGTRIAVKQLNKKLQTGNATFKDVTNLATQMSKVTSQGIGRNLPETEYVAFAEEVIAPIYTKTQKTILNAGKRVQGSMLKKAKLGIQPADVKEDTSRVKHIVGRFREAESIDTVSFLIGQDVAENILKSAVYDTIKGNANNLSDMGFETYITRSDGAGCCDWCASMVGTYKAGELPDDFWGVHKGCSCSFDYVTKDTHSRITFSTNEKGETTKNTEYL